MARDDGHCATPRPRGLVEIIERPQAWIEAVEDNTKSVQSKEEATKAAVQQLDARIESVNQEPRHRPLTDLELKEFWSDSEPDPEEDRLRELLRQRKAAEQAEKQNPTSANCELEAVVPAVSSTSSLPAEASSAETLSAPPTEKSSKARELRKSSKFKTFDLAGSSPKCDQLQVTSSNKDVVSSSGSTKTASPVSVSYQIEADMGVEFDLANDASQSNLVSASPDQRSSRRMGTRTRSTPSLQKCSDGGYPAPTVDELPLGRSSSLTRLNKVRSGSIGYGSKASVVIPPYSSKSTITGLPKRRSVDCGF